MGTNLVFFRSFAFVDDLWRHIRKDHDNEEEEEDEIDHIQMAREIKVILPADLRCLECPLCHHQVPAGPGESRSVLLAQDRQALKKHVRHEHGDADFDRTSVNYKCRWCCWRSDANLQRRKMKPGLFFFNLLKQILWPGRLLLVRGPLRAPLFKGPLRLAAERMEEE